MWRDTPGEHLLKIRRDGTVVVHRVVYRIGNDHVGRQVHVVHDTEKISFYDTITGELRTEHPLPAPEVTYVGNGQPRGGHHPKPSPMS